jgi:hypothetical protein
MIEQNKSNPTISQKQFGKDYTFRDLQNVETILKGEFGELWLFDKTPGDYRYKCYTENKTFVRQILSWNGAKKGATYCRQDGIIITHDVIIPKSLVKRVCQLLAIPFLAFLRTAALEKINRENHAGDTR